MPEQKVTVEITVTPSEAREIATALSHVRKEVFNREGSVADLLNRVATKFEQVWATR
jgi:hypothetical protein